MRAQAPVDRIRPRGDRACGLGSLEDDDGDGMRLMTTRGRHRAASPRDVCLAGCVHRQRQHHMHRVSLNLRGRRACPVERTVLVRRKVSDVAEGSGSSPYGARCPEKARERMSSGQGRPQLASEVSWIPAGSVENLEQVRHRYRRYDVSSRAALEQVRVRALARPRLRRPPAPPRLHLQCHLPL